jgi:nicotinamide-nucleotide amidase
MKIAILSIGDELLFGELVDTNAAAIARALAAEGLTVAEMATVADNEAAIINALQRLACGNDAVIVSGGLGPTGDDLTAKAAAKAFGRPLVLNDEALRQIRSRFETLQRPMHPANQKQAMLPNRCSVIRNRNGTAPGFRCRHSAADAFFLPGVPHEMQAMLDESVLPALTELSPDRPQTALRLVTVFGLAEPEVETRIHRQGLPNGVELAFNVELPLVHVKLRAQGDDANRRVDRAELELRRALDDYIVGVDGETLAETTARLLITASLSVAVAESCTGGLIAKLLTDRAGASAFFERAIVSYANSAKRDCLAVPQEVLERHGAVSAVCARAMADGVRTAASSDIGIAVTGIAGPDGGSAEKPVGTVFIALSGPSGERCECFHFSGDRAQVRLRTACTALDWLRRQATTHLIAQGTEAGAPP